LVEICGFKVTTKDALYFHDEHVYNISLIQKSSLPPKDVTHMYPLTQNMKLHQKTKKEHNISSAGTYYITTGRTDYGCSTKTHTVTVLVIVLYCRDTTAIVSDRETDITAAALI
jgi:hypothetical protein